ncbi:MAG: Ig-like domain-containing protein [Gemmatimonadaceae bacterium]
MGIPGTDRSARSALARASSLTALLYVLASCSEPPTRTEALRPLDPIVSEPIDVRILGASALPLTSAGPAAGDRAFGFAYISLRPGTATEAVSVTIRDDSRGTALTAPLRDGGLDPTPVQAAPDDELRLDLTLSSGAVTTLLATVPRRRPPTVVRTDPPKQKTGIALNARILVVFSEPIDPASLTTSSVQLVHGTTTVPGTVALQAGSPLSAEFVPRSRLEPFTPYRLVVTQNVRDLDGTPLEEPVTVEFTTGDDEEARVASLSLIDSYRVLTNDTAHLRVVLKNAVGKVVQRPVTWSSNNPASAVVWPTDSGGVVAGVGVGVAIVTATSDGITASARIEVEPPEASPYPATTLGALGGRSGTALALNDHGEIVGAAENASGTWRGFFRTTAGVMVDIGENQPADIGNTRHIAGWRLDPATRSTYAVRWIVDASGVILKFEELGPGIARGVNNLGQVVGAAPNASGQWRAAIWIFPDAPPQDLGALGEGYSEAQDINDRGVIVGYSYRETPGVQYAVRWIPTTGVDGETTWTIEVLPDQKYNSAFAVTNSSGDIVGTGLPCEPGPGCWGVGYLWRGTSVTILPKLLGGPSAALDINDAGYVVGWSDNQSGSHRRAVVWTPTGEVVALGLPRGASASEAYAINAAGQIVGFGQLSDGRRSAAVWNLFK